MRILGVGYPFWSLTTASSVPVAGLLIDIGYASVLKVAAKHLGGSVRYNPWKKAPVLIPSISAIPRRWRVGRDSQVSPGMGQATRLDRGRGYPIMVLGIVISPVVRESRAGTRGSEQTDRHMQASIPSLLEYHK